MSTFLALPILGFALMLQLGIISRINLLSGSADLILTILAAWSLQERVKNAWFWAVVAGVMVGFVSGLPLLVPLAGYLLLAGSASLLQRRVWQAPLLASFVLVVVGTAGMHFLTMGYLFLGGSSFRLVEAISMIMLPSTLLNWLLVIPVYFIIKDLADWVIPTEVKI
jgi:cell shape-determining protein MreD